MNASVGEPDGGRNDRHTAGGPDQGDQRLRVPGLENDLRTDLSEATRTIEHLARGKPLPQHEHALALEIGDIDGRAPPQRVPTGHCGKDTDWKQRTPVESIVTAASRQGELDFASLDELQGLNSASFDQVDIDSGSRLQIPREKRRQHVLDHLRRAGDAQTSRLAASDGLRMLGELAHAGEELSTA